MCTQSLWSLARLSLGDACGFPGMLLFTSVNGPSWWPAPQWGEMQQPGDEGPWLQMWLGSIRQDQECSSGGLCVWGRVLGVEGREDRNGREHAKHSLSRLREADRQTWKTAAETGMWVNRKEMELANKQVVELTSPHRRRLKEERAVRIWEETCHPCLLSQYHLFVWLVRCCWTESRDLHRS